MSRPDADQIFRDELWNWYCIDRIEFQWDQWARCRITCSHGSWSGVSRGIGDALGGSLRAATDKFLTADVTHDDANGED